MQDLFNRNLSLRRKVLVVDDELINRELLGNIISSDYEVLYATDGIEAMNLIHKHEQTLSLIMLDLLMPNKDGYEVLHDLQESVTLMRIPVIVLTSEKSAEVKSLELGAADFISKPYDMPEVILARVRRSIQLAESYAMINRTEHDSLTGLYNHEYFMEYCDQYNRFFPHLQTDCIMLNVNKFHLINELHGREYGDKILKSIASYIRGLSIKLNGIVGRRGDDSFLMYLPHQNDYSNYITELETHIHKDAPNARISLRIGICENNDHTQLTITGFERANTACSRGRSSYKTAINFYDTALHDKELYCERLMHEMDKALKEKQFCVCFQPKYNITGDTPILTSAEALIRWQHPELGMISPGQFIPLFEENGLIHKLDHYVWDETAANIRIWKDKFGTSVPVSVNVSRMDIYDPNLEQELLNIIHTHGLSPTDLLLEVTESAYTDNSSQIVNTVEQLRSHGFRVEMDDFGSGYSSLNMLSDLPIDALKLDMGFVRNICTSDKDMRMVKLMIDIAKYLEVAVIAEGVETKEQYLKLQNAGCDIIQGYYFSKPLFPVDFEKLIINKEWKC